VTTRLAVGPAGARVAVRLYGGGGTARLPLLVCLHGFTGTGATWAGLAGTVRDRFRVAAPDAPGHGLSDAPDDPAAYGLWTTADRVAEAIDRLGGRPAHVLGYSMGGRIALHLALAHPGAVASLVLEGASPGIADAAERARRRASDEAWAARIERDGIEAFADAWQAQPLFASQASLSPRAFARQRATRLGQRAAGLAASLRGAGAGAQEDLRARLGSLELPVLYVAGGLDERYRQVGAAVAAAIPGARLAVVADAGHAAHLERPAAFARAVTAFWDAIGAGAPP